MIGFLKGIVFQIKEQKIILDINDIGYKIYILKKDLNKIKIKEKISLYIYYYQKEDNIFLFGFLSEKTKEIFEILINVNGIGPKMGMNILSGIDDYSLINSVLNKDTKELTAISGIGEKIAQRIILELQGKFNEHIKINEKSHSFDNEFKKNNFISADIEKALFFLGYTKKEISNVLEKIIKKENMSKNINELIKIALKELSK